MKNDLIAAILATILCVSDPAQLFGDGLIHQLPKDGTWVRFDVTGEGLAPGGEVRATIMGSVTIKSVGQEEVEGTACRWIEIETEMNLQAVRGPRSKRLESFKLLIPEKNLATGQNPLAHAIKGWRKDRTNSVTELDLKNNNVPGFQNLEELLNGGMTKSEKTEGVERKLPARTYKCTHVNGKEESESGDVEIAIQSWLTNEVPFGIVAYRYTKMRKREKESLGGRWMELTFVESGTDAKSTVAPGSKAN